MQNSPIHIKKYTIYFTILIEKTLIQDSHQNLFLRFNYLFKLWKMLVFLMFFFNPIRQVDVVVIITMQIQKGQPRSPCFTCLDVESTNFLVNQLIALCSLMTGQGWRCVRNYVFSGKHTGWVSWWIPTAVMITCVGKLSKITTFIYGPQAVWSIGGSWPLWKFRGRH